MVVNPKDVSKITKEEEEDLSKLEKEIDLILGKELGKNLQTSVRYLIPKETTVRVITMIDEKYSRAGWDVQRDHDQREGNYLVFNIKPFSP